jgi:DNA-binding NarL/FixJ family response regulator
MIRIVLVDDHSMITDGVSSFFLRHDRIEVAGAFNSPLQALKELQNLEADIVLTDLSMPEMSGQQFIQQLHKYKPALRIIVLSMFADKALIAEAIQAGASGYVLKNAGRAQLEECIYAVYEGGRSYPVDLDDPIMKQLLESPQAAMHLSDRELEILQLVADGFSSKQVAEKLYLSEFTVNTHRRNMLRKTNQPNVAGLISMAKQRNWIN